MISSSTVVNSVVEKLRQALARGQWRTGDMLPGQRELAEQLGISRPSLREAVTVLETLGLVRSLPGKGVLVLDADALNAIAKDSHLQARLQERSASGWITVLTPHPLEAARLLGSDTATVMSDRLAAAQSLSDRFAAICVLKGSGSVISAPGRMPMINASGNAALATAGTGDVLAGMIGSRMLRR